MTTQVHAQVKTLLPVSLCVLAWVLHGFFPCIKWRTIAPVDLALGTNNNRYEIIEKSRENLVETLSSDKDL
jgi:hypothetical protein